MEDIDEDKHEDIQEEEMNGMDLLLEWLSPEREDAAKLYMELWQRLVYYFLPSFDDAESLADETLRRTMEKLKDGTIKYKDKPQKYVYGVARLIKFEEFRKMRRYVPWNEETGESPPRIDDGFPEELYQMLENCIAKLPYDKQQLLLEYTLPPDGVSEDQYRLDLAASWKIRIETLRVKILRLKEGLRKCVEKRRKELGLE